MNKKGLIKTIIIIGSILLVGIMAMCIVMKRTPQNVTKVQDRCKYIVASSGKILLEGEKLPKKPQEGDIYSTYDYEYVYYDGVVSNSDNDNDRIYTGTKGVELKGWHLKTISNRLYEYEEIVPRIAGEAVVHVSFYFCSRMTKSPKIPKYVINMYEAFYGCTSLKEAPELPEGLENMVGMFVDCKSLEKAPKIPANVTSLYRTFNGCTSLQEAPVIPNGVTNMRNTFLRCTNLQKAPVIPQSVTNMQRTFGECTSLSGNVEINANPDNYKGCFQDVDFEKQNITLSGTSEILEELKLAVVFE